jgi:hypothetical protein
MGICRTVAGLLLGVIAVAAVAQKADCTWNWRGQEIIGRTDASLGNTSKLTEAERGALIDAIVLRLQKQMTQAGYDNDRIREIASTTRVRLVDLGSGTPLLFATSMGMEGGCDARGNCPLWIFRRGSEGFVALLDAVAASYTVQSDELVLMHHVSQKQSGLEVYRRDDSKLIPTGCYTANWPAASDDPAQVLEPEIVPCKEGTAEPAESTPEAKPEVAPSPDAKPSLPDAPQAGEAKPEAAEQKQPPAPDSPTEVAPKADAPEAKPETPASDSKPSAPDAPAQSDVKPAPDAPPSDSKPVTPEAPQAGEAKPEAQEKQEPAQNTPAEPQPKPDTPEAKPETPPPSDSNQAAPDAPPADSKPTVPDTPSQPDSKPTAPDAPQTGDAKPDSSDQKQQPAPDQGSPNPQIPPEQPQAPPQSDAH